MRRFYHLPDNPDEITTALIEALITNKKKEDSFIDYKGKMIPKDISDIVCSFLNNLGGHIIFGIEEKGNLPTKIIGISKKELIKLNTKLKNIRPYIDLFPYIKEIGLKNDSILGVLFIPRFPNQWFLSKGRFYIRRGDSSDPIDSETGIESWKNNHPENRIELHTIIDRLQTNAYMLNKLDELKGQCDSFISQFISVLTKLLPMQLPGIERGFQSYFQKNIVSRKEVEDLKRYANLVRSFKDNKKASVECINLTSDWVSQRIWFMVGNLWVYIGQFSKALDHYLLLDSVNPVMNEDNQYSFEIFNIEFNKGFVFYHLNEYEAAKESFLIALKYRPDSSGTLNNLGVMYGKLNEENKAIEFFDKALSINPNDALAWSNKGIALKNIEKYIEALKAYDNSLKIDPTNIRSLNNKGIVLRRLKRHKQALQELEKALLTNPDYIEALITKGTILRDLGKEKDALKYYEKAINLDPTNNIAWFNKGNSLQTTKKFDLALEAYEKSINLNPNLKEVWINRGTLLAELERYDDALKNYDDAIEKFPDLIHLYTNKGVILTRLEQCNSAKIIFEVGIGLDSHSPELWTNYAHLCIRMQEFEKALEFSERAIKLNEKIPEAWFNKAISLTEIGDLKKAYRANLRALRLRPKYTGALKLKSQLDEYAISTLKNRFRNLIRRIIRKKDKSKISHNEI